MDEQQRIDPPDPVNLQKMLVAIPYLPRGSVMPRQRQDPFTGIMPDRTEPDPPDREKGGNDAA